VQDLLDEAYLYQVTGKAWTNTFWAGQNINNLSESLEDVAVQGDLQRIRNVSPSLEERIVIMLQQIT